MLAFTALTEVMDALKGELSASALRRQDIGAEMTRLHLENDTCLSTENEIRAALGALTRLAEKQGVTVAAAPVLTAVPYEAPPQEAAAPTAGDQPMPAAVEAAPASPNDVPFANITEPLNRNRVIPRERAIEQVAARVATKAEPVAAKVAVAKPQPAARTAAPRKPLPQAEGVPVQVAHVDERPAVPARGDSEASAAALADRIAAELAELMRLYPDGPRLNDLVDYYDVPEARVRNAISRLQDKRQAGYHMRKSTGFRHVLPYGARP